MAPPGPKTSGEVEAGRVVDAIGPEPLVAALVCALRAKGSEVERYTHRFHTYPARLHPDAAQALLAALPGCRVLDPFCGGGTVLVEALVAGRSVIGCDINPVALLVATARTRLLDAAACAALQAAGAELARGARSLAGDARARLPRAVVRLRGWYAPHALAELGLLHDLIEGAEPRHRLLLRAVHSSLVVKYSRRQSDTSAERVEFRDRPGQVVRAFRDRANELTRMLAGLRAATPAETPEPRLVNADARAASGPPVDLVCASPPYPATYDYVAQQQLRLAWLSECSDVPSAAYPHEARRMEIGSRQSFRASVEEGFARWTDDTERWLTSAAGRLREGGFVALMVGDGLAAGRCVAARPATIGAARAAGLELWAAASIERVDPGMRLAKREHALVFTKPSRQATSGEHKREPPRSRNREARR